MLEELIQHKDKNRNQTKDLVEGPGPSPDTGNHKSEKQAGDEGGGFKTRKICKTMRQSRG